MLYPDNDFRCFDGENLKFLQELLIGRKIIQVDLEKQTMLLDNNQLLEIEPNSGCGGCCQGEYELTYLEKFDNVITDVTTACNLDSEDNEIIRVFVFAGTGIGSAVINVEGYGGEGYYGRGFDIYVYPIGVQDEE